MVLRAVRLRVIVTCGAVSLVAAFVPTAANSTPPAGPCAPFAQYEVSGEHLRITLTAHYQDSMGNHADVRTSGIVSTSRTLPRTGNSFAQFGPLLAQCGASHWAAAARATGVPYTAAGSAFDSGLLTGTPPATTTCSGSDHNGLFQMVSGVVRRSAPRETVSMTVSGNSGGDRGAGVPCKGAAGASGTAIVDEADGLASTQIGVLTGHLSLPRAQLWHARRITLPINVYRSVTVPGYGGQNGNPDKSTYTVTITGSVALLRSGTCRVCQIPG